MILFFLLFTYCLVCFHGLNLFEFFAYVLLHIAAAKEEQVEEDYEIDGYPSKEDDDDGKVFLFF